MEIYKQILEERNKITQIEQECKNLIEDYKN